MANTTFNLEDKIKWGELAPSLQARFTELEDEVNNQYGQYESYLNGIRITFGEQAPFNPKNNQEIWVDTKYKVVRYYAENNWEFTRASWYGGDSSGIQTPPTTDTDTPEPDIPEYETKWYTDNYFDWIEENGGMVKHQWDQKYTTTEAPGVLNVRAILNGVEPPYATVTIDGTALTTADNTAVGYLLAVTGKASEGTELGQAHVWEIKKGVSVEEKVQMNIGDYIIVDSDSKLIQVEYIIPGNKPNDTLYMSTYFPDTFPYRYDILNWNNPNAYPPSPTRNYPTVTGRLEVKVTLSYKE